MALIKNNFFVNIILPILLGIGILYYYQNNSLRKADDIGLGVGTAAYFPVFDNYPIHINDTRLTDTLIAGWKKRGSKPLYLWMGNSQLHGVNQYKDGNKNCTEFLFNSLQPFNTEVFGISYPNANLQEFLVSVLYYSKKMPVKTIVLPVFYDDMREDGIRDMINTKPVVEFIKKDSVLFAVIPGIKSLLREDTATAALSADDYAGIKETTQDVSERYLNRRMENAWDIWKSRPDFRGNLFNELYILRNLLMGINPSTQRKMIPGRFNDNYIALKVILAYCSQNKIAMLIYIPPIRNDVPIPYDKQAYEDFKTKVAVDCKNAGANFLNLENIIPNKLWGMKASTNSFSGKGEVDFMHFQEAGHRIIADTIFKTLVKIQ